MDTKTRSSWNHKVARFYDGFAPMYSVLRSIGHRWDHDKAYLVKHLAPRPGDVILDVGTGPGIYATDLAKSVPDCKVVGVDISARFVEIAQRRARRIGITNTEFRLGNVERLAFSSNTFDKVICAGVISLVANREQALAEIHRVLKPGGVALLREPVQATGWPSKLASQTSQAADLSNWWDKMGLMFGNFHPRFFREPDFERLLDGARFARISVHRIGSDLIGRCHK